MKTSKLLITSLLAAAAMSVPAFAETTTNWAGGIDPSTGRPLTEGFAEASAAASTGQKVMTANTVFTFTSGGYIGVSGSNGFDTAGHDVKLTTSATDTKMTINGKFLGNGDVWFAQGRWETVAAGRFAELGDIYAIGGQIYFTAAETLSKNFFLGTGTFNEGTRYSALNNASLRFDTDIVFNGKTTILAEGTKLAFNGDRTATFADLAGTGDISIGVYSGSSVLKVTGATDYTGKINLVSGVTLNWTHETATFGGLSGNGAVAAGSKLNIAKADSDSTTFTGRVGASGNGVALDVSGTGTQGFSGTSWFSTVSVGNAADASDGFTMVELSGATNVSDTITVKNLSLLSIAESGSLDFNTMNIEAGGAVTLAGTVKINSDSDLITVASGGNLAVVQSTVVFDIASSLFTDGAATLTIASGSGSGSFSNWNKLETKNFFVDGVIISGRSEVDSSTNGQVSITLGTAASIVWNGGNSGTWDTLETNKIWTNAALTTEDKSDAFYTRDNVTFNTAGSVAVTVADGGVIAGNLTVSQGNVVLSGGDVTVLGTATIASGASLSYNNAGTQSLVVSSTDGTFIKTGTGTLTLSNASTANEGSTNNKPHEGTIDGIKYLTVDAGKVILGNMALHNTSGLTVTVNSGATLDLNGKTVDYKFAQYVLNGGALVNNGAHYSNGNTQATSITLGADSEIGGSKDHGLLGGSFDATTLALNGHTLTKTGAGAFWLTTTDITTTDSSASSAGTIRIEDGSVKINDRHSSKKSDASKADFVLAGGKLNLNGYDLSVRSISGTSGTLELGAKTLTVGENSDGSDYTLSAAITGSSGTFIKKGSGVLRIGTTTTNEANAGRLSGGTMIVSEGSVELSGRNDGTASVKGAIEIAGGAKLVLKTQDTLGYDDNCTVSVTAQGTGTSETAVAKIQLDNTQTLTTNLNLNGYSLMTGFAFNSFGGSITAAGTNNKIENSLLLRKDITISVTGLEDTLEMLSIGVNTADDRGGSITKTGAGTLILSGSNSFGTNGSNQHNLTISEGSVVASHASALGTGKTTVKANAKLGLVAGVTVTGVTGGIELAENAKLVIDMTGQTAGTEDIVLTLISNTALKYNENAFDSDCTNLLCSVVVLENLSETLSAWTQSLSYADNTLSLTLTIPEPSTFGLLAGAGALALVAARRRRTKKA